MLLNTVILESTINNWKRRFLYFLLRKKMEEIAEEPERDSFNHPNRARSAPAELRQRRAGRGLGNAGCRRTTPPAGPEPSIGREANRTVLTSPSQNTEHLPSNSLPATRPGLRRGPARPRRSQARAGPAGAPRGRGRGRRRFLRGACGRSGSPWGSACRAWGAPSRTWWRRPTR